MGLDIVEAFMAVEQEFGIEVPSADAARMATVGALFDYVRRHVPADPQSSAPEAGVDPYGGPLWDRYLAVLTRETGWKRDRLRPDARWVDDLRMD